MKATFWGHSCVLVEVKGKRIVIDPFLSGNPVAKTKPENVKCDYVIISHGHRDHLGDAVQIAKANDATVIANFEVASYCEMKGCNVHPMHIAGAHKFDVGRVKLTIAHHGSGLIEDGKIIYLGNPAGIIIQSDGKVLYHAGDTGLFYDMKLIGEMNKIDVAFLPIGDNFTMGVDDAVKAVELLQPRKAVPIHYKTFDVIDVDPVPFITQVAARGIAAQILEVGQSVEI